MKFYVLDEQGEVRHEPDFQSWKAWFIKNTIVRMDELEDGNVLSTVFMGVDISSPPLAEPPLFETIFITDDDPDGATLRRYFRRPDALRGHAELLDQVRAGDPPE